MIIKDLNTPLSALNDNDLITPDHAARILNITPEGVKNYKNRGALPFIKKGGRVFFTAADVKALLNAREEKAAALNAAREEKAAALKAAREEKAAAREERLNTPLSALNDNDLITPDHAARILNITRKGVQNCQKRGALPFIKKGRFVYFTAASVKAFLNARERDYLDLFTPNLNFEEYKNEIEKAALTVENHAEPLITHLTFEEYKNEIEKEKAALTVENHAESSVENQINAAVENAPLNDNDLITPDHAARILNCARRSVDAAKKRGALPFIKKGNRVFFTAAGVKALLNAREEKAAALKAARENAQKPLSALNDNDLITLDHAAWILKIQSKGLAALQKRQKRGALPFIKKGERVFFKAADVKALLNAREEKAAALKNAQKPLSALNDNDLITRDHAARILNITPSVVEIYKKRGALPFIKKGRFVYFTAADVKALLNARKNAQIEKAAALKYAQKPLNEINDNDLITRDHAARILNIKLDKVNRYQNNGALPFIKKGGRVFFKAADVKALLNAREEKAAALKAARENAQKPLSALNDNDLITIDHAARILNLTPASVIKYEKRGALPFIKSGERVFFTAADVKKFLKERDSLKKGT